MTIGVQSVWSPRLTRCFHEPFCLLKLFTKVIRSQTSSIPQAYFPLEQEFSNLSAYQELLETLLKCSLLSPTPRASDATDLRRGPRIPISRKCPGEADAANLGSALRTALAGHAINFLFWLDGLLYFSDDSPTKIQEPTRKMSSKFLIWDLAILVLNKVGFKSTEPRCLVSKLWISRVTGAKYLPSRINMRIKS